jgi:hypothetical protein
MASDAVEQTSSKFPDDFSQVVRIFLNRSAKLLLEGERSIRWALGGSRRLVRTLHVLMVVATGECNTSISAIASLK